MLMHMTLLTQLTVAAVFIGLSVYLGGGLPRRVTVTVNSLGAGVILFLIIKLVSDVVTRLAELFRNEPGAVPFSLNPWIFSAISIFSVVGIPLILVFIIRERRRSVILAIAFGLFNLTLALVASTDTVNGLYSDNIFVTMTLALLFLLEGLAIGSLLIKNKPGLFYVLTLGLTVSLPAVAGFNLGAASNLDLVLPFSQAAAAGFLIFYLPFIIAVGKNEDVKWQFIGMLTGLILTGAIITALPLLGNLSGY